MRNVLAGTLVVLAFAVAGCGGGGSPSTNSTQRNDNGESAKSANQVFADAVKAAGSASFVRMNGNVTADGQQVSGVMKFAKGDGSEGSLIFDGKYPAQLIVIGKDGYLQANPPFWNHFAGANGALISQRLDGRWLKFPVDNAQFQPLVAFATPKTLFNKLKSSADSTLKNNGTTTYNGQSVVALDGKNGTLYVAASGNAYPVAVVKKGSDGGTVSFTAWNHPFPLTAPTDVVDYSQLLSG